MANYQWKLELETMPYIDDDREAYRLGQTHAESGRDYSSPFPPFSPLDDAYSDGFYGEAWQTDESLAVFGEL